MGLSAVLRFMMATSPENLRHPPVRLLQRNESISRVLQDVPSSKRITKNLIGQYPTV